MHKPAHMGTGVVRSAERYLESEINVVKNNITNHLIGFAATAARAAIITGDPDRVEVIAGHCQLGGPVRRYGHGLIGRTGSHDPCQAAVVVPVTSVQVVNQSVISRRYSWAESR